MRTTSASTRDTPLKKSLFACDELSGFVHACGLVRPTGLEGLEPKSVKKKLKQPSFAAGVSREDVYEGAELLELELDEHIANVVAALQPIAGELGLRTEAASSAFDEALEVAAVVPPADRRAQQAGARQVAEDDTALVERRGRPRPCRRRARNVTSVAWPGSVTTSCPRASSSSRQRSVSSRARSKRPAGRSRERSLEPGERRRRREGRVEARRARLRLPRSRRDVVRLGCPGTRRAAAAAPRARAT